MIENAAVSRRAVVDLLASWGATAQPGMPELFEALESFGVGGRLGLLPRVLELPGVELPAELRRELQDAVAARHAAPGDPPPLARLEERAASALLASLAGRRAELSAEVARWTRFLDPGERDPILERMWAASSADDLRGLLDAVQGLGEARSLLDGARRRVEDGIRSAIGPNGAAAGNATVLGAAREALASADPSRLAAVRRMLAGIAAQEEQGRVAGDLSAARQRVAELCLEVCGREQARSDGGGGGSRGRAIAAAEAAEELVRESAAPESPAETAALIRALAAWEGSLAAVLEGQSAPGGSSVERRRAVADALLAELKAAAAESAGGGTAAEQFGRDLAAATQSGGPAFHDALGQATAWLDARRGEGAAAREAAEQTLRESVSRLTAQLERSAAILPTGRVVAARRLFEEAEAAIAVADPRAAKALGERISSEAADLRRLADLAEEYRASREAAERKRIRGGIERLRGLARGRAARRLAALSAKLEAGGADGLEGVDAELRSVASTVGNEIRLEAAGLVHRAGRQLSRARGKPAEAELERAVAAARTALGEDDLGGMVRESAALRKRLPRLTGPVVYAGLGGLGVVLALSAWLAWQSMTGATREYRLRVMGDEVLQTVATMLLVRDGSVFAEKPYRAGQPTSFDLPDGRYEVYVNGMYTGSVVRVPDDPVDVNDIPLPR